MRLYSFVAALGVCTMYGTAFAAPMNLVTNGSFEQGPLGFGSFQGWQVQQGDVSTFVDSNGQTGTKYGQATDGKWAAYFGSSQASGGASITQTLTTTAGQSYVLAFDLANDNGGFAPSNDFTALIDGTALFSAMDLPAQNYVHEQFSFQASGTATTLTFAGYNGQGYDELDNVVVDAAVATTPEPSSFALLGTGLLGTVGVMRKRFA
jgi:hypothetical protein